MSDFDEAPEPEQPRVALHYMGETKEFLCDEIRLTESVLSNGKSYVEVRFICGLRDRELEQVARERGLKLMTPADAIKKLNED